MSIILSPINFGQRQRGLTFVELVIFIVIVSVAVVGVVQVLNLAGRSSVDPQLRKQALAIAEGLLEEVELARFTYCDPQDDNAETATSAGDCTASLKERLGPESGNTGRPYDNVNDYVTQFGVPQTPFNAGGAAAGALLDAAGNPMNVTGTYSATLTIKPEPLGPAGLQIASAANAGDPADLTNVNVLRVTVTVTYGPFNDKVTLEGYRVRYAPTSVP